MQVRRRLLISGKVQGVGFRAAAAAEAYRLGLTGWVRNLRDGRVECAVQGPEETVARFVSWCRVGPPGSRVEGVQVQEVAVEAGEEGFVVRPTV